MVIINIFFILINFYLIELHQVQYNTYKNFEERGKDYKKWIKDIFKR